jgi:hypothetical protein
MNMVCNVVDDKSDDAQDAIHSRVASWSTLPDTRQEEEELKSYPEESKDESAQDLGTSLEKQLENQTEEEKDLKKSNSKNIELMDQTNFLPKRSLIIVFLGL